MHLIRKIHQHTRKRKRKQRGRQKILLHIFTFLLFACFFCDNNAAFCRLPEFTSGDVKIFLQSHYLADTKVNKLWHTN
jgi:hypothetical protein